MPLLHLRTWPEVEAYLKTSKGMIIPIGSTEQHGPMGLIGTDALCAEAIAKGVGETTAALVAPTISVGMALHHTAFPGTISLRPNTLILVIRDYVVSLVRAGFQRFFFINGHGGNIATVKAAFAETYAVLADLHIPEADQVRCELANWFMCSSVMQLARELYGDREGSHATPSEVAVTQFLYPEAIKRVPLNPEVNTSHAIYSAADFRRRYPDGRMGADSSLAAPEHGQQFYERAVQELSDRYRQFLQADQMTFSLPAQTWHWHSYPILYRHQGTQGTPLLLIHGFGASSLHWRKNIPTLAAHHQVYAIDLLGFGGSAKPAPSVIPYTFETWARLVLDFCREVIGQPTVLIGNSIGCVVTLQAAVFQPLWVSQLILLNCSLRQLHDRKRQQLPWYRRWGTSLLQQLLGNRALGTYFFRQIAQPGTVRRILHQAYANTAAVTDELVEILLTPAQDAGAADVFLAFVRYSQGPLPEDLLPQITCPTYFLWGAADPWEPINEGQKLAQFPCVQEFVALPKVGHCPQDEAPEQVNAHILKWLGKISITG